MEGLAEPLEVRRRRERIVTIMDHEATTTA
jgi:hypothetical protein